MKIIICVVIVVVGFCVYWVVWLVDLCEWFGVCGWVNWYGVDNVRFGVRNSCLI